MTISELRELNVIIRGYTIPQDIDYGPDYYKRCKFTEALEVLTGFVESCPEDFYNLQFSVNTEDDNHLFWIRRDLHTVYVRKDKLFDLTKKLVRKALGIEIQKVWVNGMMGVVVGDALGGPVQSAKREELKINPIRTMERSLLFDMPPGAWSDDSSMALATLDSIREKNDISYSDIMERFVKWLFHGEYTPTGKAFDQGDTCTEAIYNYDREKDYRTCGLTGEWANGNGALMRIMPVCLYAYEMVLAEEWEEKHAVRCVHKVSALTHNHLRSQIACGIYYFLVKNIIEERGSLAERIDEGTMEARLYYAKDPDNEKELEYYKRIKQMREFAKLTEDEIKSTGYVVDSLEAAIWCLVTTDSFKECLLKAVNLGGDTDTIGAIAGGLAGLYYGYDSIPEEWRNQIIKRDEIIALCEVMEERFDVQ